MNIVLILIYVIGCALGVLLATTLLAKIYGAQTNFLIASLILIVSIDVSIAAIKHLLPAQAMPTLLHLASFPELLFAPLLYLYLKAQRATQLTVRQSWHFIFFALFQLVAVYELEQPSMLPWLTIHAYLNVCCLLVMSAYTIAIFRISRIPISEHENSIFHNQTIMLIALLAALVSYLLVDGAGIFDFQFENIRLSEMAVVLLFTSLAALAYSAFCKVLYNKTSDNDTQTDKVEPQIEVEKEKYGNNRLPEFVRESIINELKKHMQSAQPWLQMELTLSQLATSIHVNPHHLSQIINSEFGKTFACYINEHRINEACKLLSDDSEKTVLEIALQSGFSSKSSFNTLFKKQTELTPSEYRKKFQRSDCAAA